MNELTKPEKVLLRQMRLLELRRIMKEARLTVQRVIGKAVNEGNLAKLIQNGYWTQQLSDLNKVYKGMDTTWSKWITDEMEDAYADASALAQSMLRRANLKKQSNIRTAGRVVDALISDSVNKFIGMTEGGYGMANTLFREVQTSALREYEINQALGQSLVADATPQRAQSALEKAIRKDMLVDGKVLAGSKKYMPETYSELVARTRVRDAQTAATIDACLEYGVDLVQVSDHNTTTPLCMQYEGQIYSISGRTPGYPKLGDVAPFHPNCLHVMLPLPIGGAEDEARLRNQANEIKQRNQSKLLLQGATQ